MIAMYDLEDNIIAVFDNYKECAEYFKTSKKVIYSYFCKNKKGVVDKKYDKERNIWVRLFKIDE